MTTTPDAPPPPRSACPPPSTTTSRCCSPSAPRRQRRAAGARMSAGERARVRERLKATTAADVNAFLERLPRDLLFVMRAWALVRSRQPQPRRDVAPALPDHWRRRRARHRRRRGVLGWRRRWRRLGVQLYVRVWEAVAALMTRTAAHASEFRLRILSCPISRQSINFIAEIVKFKEEDWWEIDRPRVHWSSMECAICLEPSFNTTTLPCEHIFCTRCIRRYAKTFDSELPCPTCRAPVKINELGRGTGRDRTCASSERDFREMSPSRDRDLRLDVHNCDVSRWVILSRPHGCAAACGRGTHAVSASSGRSGAVRHGRRPARARGAPAQQRPARRQGASHEPPPGRRHVLNLT